MSSPISGSSFVFQDVYIQSVGTTAGIVEHQGPLGHYFDKHYPNHYHHHASYEQAKIEMLKDAILICLKKGKVKKQHKVRDLSVYIVLRTLVIITMILQGIHRNWNDVFLCILTLFLLMIPSIIDKKLNIKLPTVLESIILLFIFAAEILGEIQNFYGIFKQWDTMLHTINGFIMAAIGFSLIDILNQSEKFSIKLAPVFVALVAFCFSMTIGVLWEFFEYGMDTFAKTDMQKDRIVSTVSSVELNEDKENKPVIIKNISQSTIKGEIDGKETEVVIQNGALDIGLIDTMKDLIVNCIGAVVFSTLGYLYIKQRGNGKFIKQFIPVIKSQVEDD